MSRVQFSLQKAGSCTSHEWIAVRGGGIKEIVFPATYGLITHPTEGHILFDTGYTRRFLGETRRFPGKVYGWMTPVFIREEEEAVATLGQMGIAPEEVRYIIISHFHADHVGGLKDFPKAQFICTKDAYQEATTLRGFSAVKKGILPGLLPSDLQDRITLVESLPYPVAKDPILGEVFDLFGDGSIRLVMLPGHAKGQLGALLQTDQGEVFLVADGCWLERNLDAGRLPNPIVNLFFDSWSDFKGSLSRIRAYATSHPETVIIPCHCETTRKRLMPAT